MYCIFCGKENKSDDNYCIYCGKPLYSDEDQNTNAKAYNSSGNDKDKSQTKIISNNKAKQISVIFFFVIAIFAAVICFTLFLKKEDINKEQNDIEEAVEANNDENIKSEEPVITEDQTEHEEEKDMITEEPTAKGILERFLANEVQASVFGDKQYYYHDIASEFEIENYEYKDIDNDDEEELLIYSEINFYPLIVLDVNEGEIKELCAGEGTAGYLTFYDVDGTTWACHSDTTHQGRQVYDFAQYKGSEIVDEFVLSAEYWESEDDQYDENSDFSYRDKKISMDEYEELLEKWTGIKSSKNKPETYRSAFDMYDDILKKIVSGELMINDEGECYDFSSASSPGYALYDIDKDGTPELFVTGAMNSDYRTYTIYSIDKDTGEYKFNIANGYIPDKEWWIYGFDFVTDVFTYGDEFAFTLEYPFEEGDPYTITYKGESPKIITEKEAEELFVGEIREPKDIKWIKLTEDVKLK